MKKILLSSLIAAAAAVPAFAGVNNINYQAVIKNGTAVVAQKDIAMKFELLDGTTVVYTEEQDVTTGANGLVTCQLGKEDELATIAWGDLTLRVSVNLGSGYEVISTEAVSSVPTALYALKTADSDMFVEAIEGLQDDVESNKTSIMGINAALVKYDGFIEDVESNLQDINDLLRDMHGLNAEEIADFHERVSNELIRINETLEEMEGTDLHAYIAKLEALQADLEAKLKGLNEYASVKTDVDDLKGQVENLNNVSAVVRVNEEAIEELQGDFKNLGENLTNGFQEMDARFEEVNGQIENLNNVSAVVRANEEAIEEIQKDNKNMQENLTNSFIVVNADIDELKGQVENLNNVSAVVRDNEEKVEMLMTEVEGLSKDNEETKANLKNLSADVAQIEGLAAKVDLLEDSMNIIGGTDGTLVQIGEGMGQLQETIDALQAEIAALKAEIKALKGE